MSGALFALLLVAAAPDLSWVADADLPIRAGASLAEAARADAAAVEADRIRAEITALRAAAELETTEVEKKLPDLRLTKKSNAQSRLKELEAKITAWTKRIADLEREAVEERSRSRLQRAHAAAYQAEDALRRRQASAAIDLADDIAVMSEERLRQGIAFHERRRKRAPVQLRANDRMLRTEPTAAGRSALIARAAQIRTADADDRRALDRIAQELVYRAETLEEQKKHGEMLAGVAAAQSAHELSFVDTTTLSSARSAEIDRQLTAIIEAEDRAIAEAEARGSMLRRVSRYSVTALVLLGGLGLIWFLVKRG